MLLKRRLDKESFRESTIIEAVLFYNRVAIMKSKAEPKETHEKEKLVTSRISPRYHPFCP